MVLRKTRIYDVKKWWSILVIAKDYRRRTSKIDRMKTKIYDVKKWWSIWVAAKYNDFDNCLNEDKKYDKSDDQSSHFIVAVNFFSLRDFHFSDNLLFRGNLEKRYFIFLLPWTGVFSPERRSQDPPCNEGWQKRGGGRRPSTWRPCTGAAPPGPASSCSWSPSAPCWGSACPGRPGSCKPWNHPQSPESEWWGRF